MTKNPLSQCISITKLTWNFHENDGVCSIIIFNYFLVISNLLPNFRFNLPCMALGPHYMKRAFGWELVERVFATVTSQLYHLYDILTLARCVLEWFYDQHNNASSKAV